jgi:hypothetical protein
MTTSQRYEAKCVSHGSYVRHYVHDNTLKIDLLHWFRGEDKIRAEAVANALNSVEPEQE